MRILIKRFNKVDSEKIVAYIDLSLNDITIRGCKLVKNNNEFFVSFPREKGKDGNYYNIIYLDNLQDKDEIEQTVINYYNKIKGV